MSTPTINRFPAWLTAPPSEPDPVCALLNHESEPYLSWVNEASRARVIDPGALPRLAVHHPPLRILLMTETLTMGGAERMVESMAAVLSGRGHEVLVWCRQPSPTRFCGRLGKAELLTCLPEEVSVVARRRGIQIAVASNGTGMDLACALKREGVRVLALPYGLTPWNVRILHDHAGALDAIAAFVAYPTICAGLLQLGYTKPCYSFRGIVNPDDFPFKLRGWRKPFRVGFVGRMADEKDLPALAGVVSRMRTSSVLHVIGGIDPAAPKDWQRFFQESLDVFHYSDAYRTLVEQKRVVEHGMLSGAAFKRALGSLHAMVLTSKFEGEPVCFMEGMASGALCVGRDIGEMHRLLTGAGILVPAKAKRMDAAEQTAMANELDEILSDPDEYRRLARAARERVETFFAPDPWASDFEAIVQAVVGMTLPDTIDVLVTPWRRTCES